MENSISTLYNKIYKKKRRYIDCNFREVDDIMQINFRPIFKNDKNFNDENIINLYEKEKKNISLLLKLLNLEDQYKVVAKETKKSN